MQVELTDEQEAFVQKAVAWYHNPDSEQTLELSGSAGTGKSLVLHVIIERLGLSELEVAPMSFTGCAAIIMRRNGFRQARTIHSSIYSSVYEMDPVTKKPKKAFTWTGLPLDKRLIVNDEAGMTGLRLKQDIDRCGLKVIACGDLNQLPPVMDNPGYLTDPSKVFQLTKIMRQTEGSAIVQLSRQVLEGRSLKPGDYGQVQVVTRSDFKRNFPDYVRNYGILLCGTNRTRDELNHAIRESIFHYESPLPLKGEKLICRKNNWDVEVDGINLVNGLYGTAMSSPSISSFEGSTFLLDFQPEFMTGVFEGLPVDYRYFRASHDVRTEMRKSAYMDDSEKFEFAYSITTHVSQGSQFDSGIYLQEYFPSHSNNLNYTGLTRFRQRALYVVPDRKRYWGGSTPYHQYHHCHSLIPVPRHDGTVIGG